MYNYGKALNGVQFLFASTTITNYSYRYGFLLSKSKDGVSADGGNAGKGGKGGGGGQAGTIDIVKIDGRPYYHYEMAMETKKGEDGRPGKTGKPGKRAIAERHCDHLCVDGAGPWRTTESYSNMFIDVKPWEHSPQTGHLGSGYYYCKKGVS